MLRKAVHAVLLFLAAPVLLTLPAGCSVFRSSTETITVATTPADAVVLVNGMNVRSPGAVDVRRDRNLVIQCMKDGYYPVMINTGYSLSTTGVLDVIGLVLILVPGIGLLTPGAWSLDQNTFNIYLQQK